MPARLLLAAALATACHATLAQDSAVPPAVSVQRLAPQLVPFAGSEANFQSLVNGLATGTQVQLFTVLPNGFIQNVSFTPTAALTPTQVAQILETARQQLIGLGIGAPDRGAARIRADGRSGADRARRHAGPRRAQSDDPEFAEPGGADPGSGQRRRDRADHARHRRAPRPGSPTASTCRPRRVQRAPRPARRPRCRAPIPATARSRPARRAAAWRRSPAPARRSTPAPARSPRRRCRRRASHRRRAPSPSAFPQAPAPRATDRRRRNGQRALPRWPAAAPRARGASPQGKRRGEAPSSRSARSAAFSGWATTAGPSRAPSAPR